MAVDTAAPLRESEINIMTSATRDLGAEVASIVPWLDTAWPEASDRPAFDVEDPSNGTVVAQLPDADAAQATAAADRAAAAMAGWAETAPRARSEILSGVHALMLEHHAELAGLISLENGKAHADAMAEVTYAAEFFRWYAEEAVRSESEYGVAPDGGRRTIVTHQPVGVAALVTPWNFPAAMVTRKIAPALAAGCTTVLKPAAETPLTALAIAHILRRAGTPDGVVNVLTTTRAADTVGALLRHPAVRKLSFTGSTEVGRILLRQAAERVVNCSMELGGNAPFVVCADADVDAAVAGALVAKLRNAGQACTAANRFYVHVDVLDEFTAKLSAAFAGRRVGPAGIPANDIGPLISARAVAGVRRLVDGAREHGATVTHALADIPDTGHFFPPMVLRDVPPDSPLVTTEIFGPVAPIVSWNDADEMIAQANATEFGLAGYVYSRDLHLALRLAESLQCGMVGVNRGVVSDPSTPFGGMKQSGMGREGARDGLRAFQETQYLSVAW